MDSDDFEDANEGVVLDLLMESDIRTAHLAQQLFFQNEFEGARELLDLPAKNMYHFHAITSLSLLEALMTFSPKDFQEALNAADKTLKESDVLSKESISARINGTLFDSSKNWSDERTHAYLVRAETIVFKTVANIMTSGTDIKAIANACFAIRESYKIFEHCGKIAKSRSWKSEILKKEFESGAKFGLGVYQLYLSILPPKVLKILEWVGFKGDREDGLKLLYDAAESDTVRTMFSKLFPIGYHYLFQFQFGSVGERNGMTIGPSNIHMEQVAKLFPKGVVIRFMQGKRAQIEGNLESAIEHFLPDKNGWTNFHHFCYWELFWCYGILGDFENAEKYINLLLQESLWSPAIYSWLMATVLFRSDLAQAKKLLHDTDVRRQRIAGKSIPDEKFASKKAKNYLTGKTKMIFPFLEAAYFFNYLKIGNQNQKIANFWLAHLKTHENELDCEHEEYGIFQLLKSNLLTQTGNFVAAAAESTIILKTFPKPKLEPHLAACATFELGNSLRLQGKNEEALKCFERAKSDYTRYPFEHRLHFRCHNFKQLIESKT